MNEEIMSALQELNVAIAELKTERDMLHKENVYLRELVHKFATRPATFGPAPMTNLPNYPEPPWKVTC